MTPMEQLDIIKGCEAVEAMDEDEPGSRDLEVLPQHISCLLFYEMFMYFAVIEMSFLSMGCCLLPHHDEI